MIKVLEELRGSWRFRWWAIAAAWCICILGWIYVIVMPDVYEANARVYVDTQSALRPLLKGLAVEPNVASNLAVVRQAILSRPNLEKVARQTHLDERAKTPEAMARLIDNLRMRVSIDSDSRARSTASDGLYRITFQDTSRDKSLEVVRTLLDSFVEDTLGSKRSGQEDAQRFLKEQIADYEKLLTEAETRLSDFKKRNIGNMPTDGSDHFTRLQAEIGKLAEVRQSLTLAESRRAELERQASGEDPYIFGFDQGQSALDSAQDGSSDIAYRIRDMEKRLEEMLLRYTEKHPEVIAVRDTIEELKSRQKEELERVKKGQGATGSLSRSLNANPVYQSIEIELKHTEVKIAELREDVAQRQARVNELQRLMNSVSDTEAELKRLNRDYDVINTQYRALVQRLETAKLSDEADKTGVVKFNVIDPPSVPFEPVAPKRTVLFLMVLVLAIGGAAGLAYVLNLLRPVFYDLRLLAEVTSLPVLGAVSRTWIRRNQTQNRIELLKLSGCMALLFVAFGVLTLWQSVGTRLAQHIVGG
jgi:polysaccharide chain length determinant protein (PEP-CTERM system associated)